MLKLLLKKAVNVSVKADSLKTAFLQFCDRLEMAHFWSKLAKPGRFVNFLKCQIVNPTVFGHLGSFRAILAHLNQFGQKTQTAICPKRFGVKKQLFVTFTSMPFFATVGQNRAKRFICNLSSNHSNFSQVTQHQHHHQHHQPQHQQHQISDKRQTNAIAAPKTWYQRKIWHQGTVATFWYIFHQPISADSFDELWRRKNIFAVTETICLHIATTIFRTGQAS